MVKGKKCRTQIHLEPWWRIDLWRRPVSEETKQEISIDGHSKGENAICLRARCELEFDDDPRHSKCDDDRVETHAPSAEGFMVHLADEIRAERNSDKHAWRNVGNELRALEGIEAQEIIGDCRESGFCDSNDTECRSKVLLGVTLVIEQQCQRWSGYCGHGIERADSDAERYTDRPLRLDRPSHAGCLKQNQWQ